MQIAIDFGNTKAKLGIFKGATLENLILDISAIDAIQTCNQYIDEKIILCSVNDQVSHLYNLIENKSRITFFDYTTPLPIVNKYKTPEKLGPDRLAAVMGAYTLSPNSHNLVIDLGTCITYEYLNSDNEYMGGSISPGKYMRAKAMHEFTARLPLITFTDVFSTIGNDTNSCIESGILNGISAEINYYIDTFRNKFPEINVYMCGGEARLFETTIKHSIFVLPELVLIGLNSILLYNES
jgi:type III pantothenate kinase